jgi:hypothetical protein
MSDNSSIPPEQPLLQQNEPDTEASEEANAAIQVTSAPEAQEDQPVELGDHIIIEGGQLDGTTGRVYYRSGELIRIMADGNTDRLVEIPLIEGEPDPALEIKTIAFISKRQYPEFVRQQGYQLEETLETFRKQRDQNEIPLRGPIYIIKGIDTTEDSITVQDNTNAPLKTIEFGYIGIPLEEDFVILRAREPLEDLQTALQEAETSVVPLEQPKPLFRILGTIKIEAIPEKQEIPEVDQTPNDAIQRADNITSFMKEKTAAEKKNPKTLKEVERYTDLLLIMRNEIVNYSNTGKPERDPKKTSALTLIDLLESGAPLSRPVLDIVKNIYVDALAGDERKSGIHANSLANVIHASLTYQALQKPIPTTENMKNAPWILRWQTYVDRFFRAWTSGAGTPLKPILKDTDFFRGTIPDLNIKSINGFPTLIFRNVQGRTLPFDDTKTLTTAYLEKINFSYMRGVSERKGKPTNKRELVQISSPDEAAILHYLLFPYTITRTMGSSRSGSLLIDSIRSQEPIHTIQDVLKEVGVPTEEEPVASNIIAVGPEGNTLGDIDIWEFLKRIPVGDVKGFADYLDVFVAIGLDKFELTTKQLETINEILNENMAMRKEALRIMIEKNKELIDNPPEVKQQSFCLRTEYSEELLNIYISEPDLKKALIQFYNKTPIYAKNDLAQLAYLLKEYPDYTDATIGGKDKAISRERIRAFLDKAQENLRNLFREQLKEVLKGSEPVLNRCPHVRDYNLLQKVPDITDRMKLFKDFVRRYRSPVESENPHFFSCLNCGLNLICKHEYELLQEFLKPMEAGVIHKNILLNFSGGQFQGKYICAACGQSIQDIEYDNSLERDENGVPLIGRGVLEDPDEKQIEDEELALGAPIFDEQDEEANGNDIPVVIQTSSGPYKFSDSLICLNPQPGKVATQEIVLKCIYGVAYELFIRLGIYPREQSLSDIVTRVHADLLKLDSREVFMRKQAALAQRKGTTAGAVDYDVYINRRLISFTACYVLIDIQTKIPDYQVMKALQGCRSTFIGYPLGPKEDTGAMEYIACAVSSVQRDRAPWNLTGWLRERNEVKRRSAILSLCMNLMDTIVQDGNIQMKFTAKQNFVAEMKGGGVAALTNESLPPSFLPHFYNPAVEGEVVTESAGRTTLNQIWLTQANELAKKTAIIHEWSPFSETSCCFYDVTRPGAFWAENNLASTGSTAPLGPYGSQLNVHFDARPTKMIRLETPDEAFPNVFLKVCFRGPRKGLPHEPGYTNFCPHCRFQFPTNPTVMEISEGEKALTEQQIIVNTETFNDLLDQVHLKYQVPNLQVKPRIEQSDFFTKLRDMATSPYTTWQADIQACFELLSALPPTATSLQQVGAWTPLLDRLRVHESGVKVRLGNDETTFQNLKSLCELNPTEVRSNLVTYFIAPFQRGIVGYRTDELEKGVSSDFKFSDQHKKKISEFLRAHYQIQNEFSTAFSSALIKARAVELLGRLHAIVNILDNLRTSLINVGGEQIIPYLIRSMIMGAVYEYADLNRVPPNAISGRNMPPGQTNTNAAADPSDSFGEIHQSLKVISNCIARFAFEAKKYTDKEVRELIKQREEVEKQDWIQRLKRMTKEERQQEMRNKKLGLGDYAVGGSRDIYAYRGNRWDAEEAERARYGHTDFEYPGVGPEGYPDPQGRPRDRDGFPIHGLPNAEDAGDYTHTQRREEDY